MPTEPTPAAGTIETLYEGQWLRLVRNGRWEYAERTHGNGMAVIIIAVTPDDEVLFVEQYRVPLGRRTIEMPAGLVGDDHDADTLESAATRELAEETGWRPARQPVMAPYRRSRRRNSAMAPARSALLKSGHSASQKTSSV